MRYTVYNDYSVLHVVSTKLSLLPLHKFELRTKKPILTEKLTRKNTECTQLTENKLQVKELGKRFKSQKMAAAKTAKLVIY